MKKSILLIVALIGIIVTAKAQVINSNVGVGTSNPETSAMLDVSSNSKGVLIPRMTKTERLGIFNPATSLMVYQTDDVKGYYFNSGTSSAPNWKLIGGYSGETLLGPSPTPIMLTIVTHNLNLSGTQNIQVTLKTGGSFTEVFATTVVGSSITANSFMVVIYRVDGTSWTHTPSLMWHITQP